MENLEKGMANQPSDLLTLKEVYFHSVVVAPESISQFKFYEDESVQPGTDRYVLLAGTKEPAVFQVTGVLTHLSVTAAGAVQHRRPNAKVDEYTARLRINEEKDLKEIERGCHALIDLLKETSRACENIAASSGFVESRLLFKLEHITVKISNYNNDVFYFNRKAAKKEKGPVDDSKTPDFLLNFPPQKTVYPVLRYPPGCNLQPLIPVTDKECLAVRLENIDLPCPTTVYFEFRQGFYNFEGNDGPVRQIVLIPTVIAIKVSPPMSKDASTLQTAKRRQISC